MTKFVSKALMALGFMTAAFGIGVDFILPGASPGLNAPQLLIIAAGLSLILGGRQLGRAQGRPRLRAPSGKSLLSAALIALVTLLALELLLTLSGMPTYFGGGEPIYTYSASEKTICDDVGCHYNYDFVIDACARGELRDRACVVNRQGLADDEDFVVRDDFGRRRRLLMLGDSFTQGYSAEPGKSFVESIEARFPDYIVWNASFRGTGTNQALVNFERYGSLLQPDLTVLGFYVNDVMDNLTSVAAWISMVDKDGNQVFIKPYRFDAWGNLVHLDAAAAEYYVTRGAHPPADAFEALLGDWRLGTLTLRLRDRIAKINMEERVFANAHAATRRYLRQLRDTVAEQASALLVLLIPERSDFPTPGKAYAAVERLLADLEIPFIALAESLAAEADYAPPPDLHWNTAGHQKVGAILGDCIEVFFDSGELRRCERRVKS